LTISEGVTTIGERAFASNHWTSNRVQSNGTSVTDHHGLKRVVIPTSVTSIGQEAFASHWTTSHYDSTNNRNYTRNHWLITEVRIGANVQLGRNAIGNGFEAAYTAEGMQAGAYRARNSNTHSGRWERFDNADDIRQIVVSRDRGMNTGNIFMILGGILTVIGIVVITSVFSTSE